MKKLSIVLAFAILAFTDIHAQVEYKVVTSVESIVPSGLGRSRIVASSEDRNYKDFTTNRTEEDDERNKSDRGDIRVKNFEPWWYPLSEYCCKRCCDDIKNQHNARRGLGIGICN